MTLGVKVIWNNVNKVLTAINAILLAVLTGNVTNPKEIRNARIPFIANVLLLVFLSVGLAAAIYVVFDRF